MGYLPLLAAWNARAPITLLAEGDPDTRQLYVEHLKRSGCVTEEADDGREALAKAIALQPDIVITETRLRGLSGSDLCDLLRRDPATRRVPVIVVTGDAPADPRRDVQISGADAVLVKPCLPETLLVEVHRLLDEPADHLETMRSLREQSVLAAAQHELGPARRTILSRSFSRLDTTDPPVGPPALVCPACDQPLRYQRSHIGGVSARHAEQWDYFECPNGCGIFEYRQRTRKLKRS